MLRAWRGLPRFAGRSSLSTWLYRIATNVCLDAISRLPKNVADRPRPAERADGRSRPSADESVWLEPFPDETLVLPHGYAAPEARYEQHEAVELAFIAALQHLPATQRAVLLLREVLGFSAREVAESLETSVASVNSALQRLGRLSKRGFPSGASRTLRAVGDERIREVVEAYVDAWRRGDVEHFERSSPRRRVLDAAMSRLVRGRKTIADSQKRQSKHRAESLSTSARANGQVALAYYQRDAETGRFRASALDVITFEARGSRAHCLRDAGDLLPLRPARRADLAGRTGRS